MVTVDKEIVTKEGFTTTNQTFYGLSTDSKPTSGGNGSCFIEIDTGKAFFFDAENSLWLEVGG